MFVAERLGSVPECIGGGFKYRLETMKTLISVVVSALTVMSVGLSAQAEVRLQGAGATFPNPIYQRWVTEYQKKNPNAVIDYQSQGSGAGIRAITEKTVAFAGSDAPLNKKQREDMEKAGLEPVHVPTVAGAVVLAYNLPGFTGDLKLSGEVVADIYQGKITTWNDPKIVELNPDAKLPAINIVPAFRTDGSGTTFIFTNYLATQSESYRESIGSGTAVKWPTGQGGKGNEGVTQVVQATPGAVGYVELIYAQANKIPSALMRNKDGKFVAATPASVALAGDGAAAAMSEKTLAVPLWNQPGEGTYPISAFTYIIVYRDLSYIGDKEKAQTLVNFLTWATTDGQGVADSMGYAPLAPAVREKVAGLIATLNYSGEKLTAK